MKLSHRAAKQLRQLVSNWQQHWWQTSTIQQGQPSSRNCLPIPKAARVEKPHIPTIAIAAVVSLTSVVGYHFYNEPKLDVGRIAPQTIRAPQTVNIPDHKTTEEKRKQARTGAVPVLMFDTAVNQQIRQNLTKFIGYGDTLRTIAGAFPFTKPSVLSMSSQIYLRKLDRKEWQTLQETLNRTIPDNNLDELGSPILPLNSIRNQALEELTVYRQSNSAMSFNQLIATINAARTDYAQAIRSLSDPAHQVEPEKFYDASFLDLSDELWLKTRNALQDIVDRILAQGIPPGLPEDIVQQLIEAEVNRTIPIGGQSLAVEALGKILQPNLVTDPERTRQRAEQAAQAVEPVMVAIKRGEIIVRTGEKISQADFVLLDHFGLSRREINWGGLIGFGTLVTGGIVIFWVVRRQYQPGLRRRDHFLLLLLSLTAPIPTMLGIPSTTLPLVGLLAGSFYGSALGGTVVGLLAIVLSVGLDISHSNLLATAAGGLVGALIAGRLRSREELALLGIVVGLTQGGVYLLLNAVFGPALHVVLGLAALQGLTGITWSVVALGCSPYLEHLFDLVTPIRLAELANPNRPLLKRLASEAPGTFQHTLFVASLAEAAARCLGCDVELVRTGCLYHDIGKMHAPLLFIENQIGGPNPHDELNDPWASMAIIKKHVTEGLVMARKYRLPKAIQAFIPEHQGTMLIAYFYHQAQARSAETGDPPVQEAEFRYDGPIPQSRETGIVMLADSCEAALRSLKEVCTEDARIMINKILRARWKDGQLAESGLSRENLTEIAEVFVQVWLQFNHRRIAYPKP